MPSPSARFIAAPLEQKSAAQRQGEIKLWLNVLQRAIRDYITDDRVHKADAERWLFRVNAPNKMFSCCWICAETGIDINKLRFALRNLTPEDKLKIRRAL